MLYNKSFLRTRVFLRKHGGLKVEKAVKRLDWELEQEKSTMEYKN